MSCHCARVLTPSRTGKPYWRGDARAAVLIRRRPPPSRSAPAGKRGLPSCPARDGRVVSAALRRCSDVGAAQGPLLYPRDEPGAGIMPSRGDRGGWHRWRGNGRLWAKRARVCAVRPNPAQGLAGGWHRWWGNRTFRGEHPSICAGRVLNCLTHLWGQKPLLCRSCPSVALVCWRCVHPVRVLRGRWRSSAGLARCRTRSSFPSAQGCRAWYPALRHRLRQKG